MRRLLVLLMAVVGLMCVGVGAAVTWMHSLSYPR